MKNYVSLKQIQEDITKNNLSCQKLVKGYLENISKHQELNAFIEVYEEEAKARAIQIDNKIKNNQAGKLAGLVIGLKDNICYKNHKVSAASKILNGFESLYSATVVERLIKEDAIINLTLASRKCPSQANNLENEAAAILTRLYTQKLN